MVFSVPINITTNAWNIIKFIAMYVLLDTAIPILLESIDKASIVRHLSRDGRVPITTFTKDRHARSGVRELVTNRLRRSNQPFLGRSQRALTKRHVLLFSIWVASIIAEYGSGSEPKITHVEIPKIFAGPEGQIQAMFTCVQLESEEKDNHVRLSVRHATMTAAGMRCSCRHPTEIGCTMPVHVENIDVAIKEWEAESYGFLSNGTVRVKKFNPLYRSAVYVFVQGRARCNMCSTFGMDPVDDIPFNVYGALDGDGNLVMPAMYAGKLETGTLVGLAYGKEKAPTEQDTLDDLFTLSHKVAFLQNVWERPGLKKRLFDIHGLSANRPIQQEFLEIKRPIYFSAIWNAWWIRGNLNESVNGVAVLNTSSTETATISLLGLLSFSYVIFLFLILVVHSTMSRKWRRALKTNGCGNVEWLISALIAQQQLRGSSLRGVDDFRRFDLTVVKNDNGVPVVGVHHWLLSLLRANPTKNLDIIDGKNPDDGDEDRV